VNDVNGVSDNEAHSLNGIMLFFNQALAGTGELLRRVMMSDWTSRHSDDAIVSPAAFFTTVTVF
jgi:hypothetical protein